MEKNHNNSQQFRTSFFHNRRRIRHCAYDCLDDLINAGQIPSHIISQVIKGAPAVFNQPSCVHLIIKVRLQCSTSRRPGCQCWHRINGPTNQRAPHMRVSFYRMLYVRIVNESMTLIKVRLCYLNRCQEQNCLDARIRTVRLFTRVLVVGQKQWRDVTRIDATCRIVFFSKMSQYVIHWSCTLILWPRDPLQLSFCNLHNQLLLI